MFYLIAWVFDEFEVPLLAANKKYQIHPECTCGCLHRLMSEEQERKWKEAENREEEDKLAFYLSGGWESVKENWLEVGLGKWKRWIWSVWDYSKRKLGFLRMFWWQKLSRSLSLGLDTDFCKQSVVLFCEVGFFHAMLLSFLCTSTLFTHRCCCEFKMRRIIQWSK